MQQLTHRVLQHKRLVIIGWLVLTVVGMMAAGPATKALNQKFSVPGREGWETNQTILHTFGNGGENPPLIPVVTLPAGKTVNSPGVRTEPQGARDQGARLVQAPAGRRIRLHRRPDLWPRTAGRPSCMPSTRPATPGSAATSTRPARCARG